MRDLSEALSGRTYAVASVVDVSGSAPRGLGSALAVTADGEAFGSVSGGCVEGAVYELAREVLSTGLPQRQRFGYSDADAFAVGLTCGGELEVFVQPATPAIEAALADPEPVVLVRVIGGPESLLGKGMAVFADRIVGDLVIDPELVRHATTTGRQYHRSPGYGGLELFVEPWSRPPRMLVFGAIDYAAALARMGKFLGYHVTVCDARPVFATAARFPDADEVVVDWPHRYLARTPTDRRTVVCVLTHDEKFDVPLLADALRRPLAFVGALGSRRTNAQRLSRLREVGLTDRELASLRAPIGLDLGASTPEETAVAIAAEIVALGRGGSGLALTGGSGPIHAPMHVSGSLGHGSQVSHSRGHDNAATGRECPR
ncbi:XdhC family protein [Kutzneria kofuensis]|uniref:Xanthine dehydrogenase accessory factor n=1 Tax=Kutzneria kofuensis TaxID=103725 RepID=A0A7W9KSB7_9PSEU|nr:XdhC/CoxI family protein [Kutzneria kofuensis]MBB5897513.1 xanthine dehydrogenase accessory factor [Kutzneria kofuensis]